MCIGLVEDEHRRIAVKRACKRYALSLARGETRSSLAKPRVVTIGEFLEEIAKVGQAGRFDDPREIRNFAEATDILGHSASKIWDSCGT